MKLRTADFHATFTFEAYDCLMFKRANDFELESGLFLYQERLANRPERYERGAFGVSPPKPHSREEAEGYLLPKEMPKERPRP